MEVRLRYLDKNKKKLQEFLFMLPDDNNYVFYKQYINQQTTKAEAVLLDQYMKDRKPTASIPCQPLTTYVEILNHNGESLSLSELVDEKPINDLVDSIKFFSIDKPKDKPLSMVMTEPLDLNISTGMNLVIQERVVEKDE